MLRLAESSPAESARGLIELEGALCVSRSHAEEPGHLKRGLAPWERVGPGVPLLMPRLPGALEERWAARGHALWIADGLVLIEAPGGLLEARCARTGAVRWSVPSLRTELGELDEDERALVLPWAVAPWGAVELIARYEAPLTFRRAGRYHAELGRVTEREVSGRTNAHVELTAHLVLPAEGTWCGPDAPEVVLEHGDGGPLADSELHPVDWDDDLLELSLDPLARQLAVRWRDDDQDWAVLRVGGDQTIPGHLAPAHWSSGRDDPFPPVPYRGPSAPPLPLDHDRFAVAGDGASLVVRRDCPIGEPSALRLDHAGGEPTPFVGSSASGWWTHTSVLRAPDEGDLDPAGASQVLLAAGQVFLQMGSGELIALGEQP